jgi:hypothetical protein
MGEVEVAKRLAEQQRALELLYDPSTMDGEQLEQLYVLLAENLLPEVDREAILNAFIRFNAEKLDLVEESVVANLEVIGYIRENPNKHPWLEMLSGYLELGEALSDRQMESARQQMEFERSSKSGEAA